MTECKPKRNFVRCRSCSRWTDLKLMDYFDTEDKGLGLLCPKCSLKEQKKTSEDFLEKKLIKKIEAIQKPTKKRSGFMDFFKPQPAFDEAEE